jgi:hypothetical protein
VLRAEGHDLGQDLEDEEDVLVVLQFYDVGEFGEQGRDGLGEEKGFLGGGWAAAGHEFYHDDHVVADVLGVLETQVAHYSRQRPLNKRRKAHAHINRESHQQIRPLNLPLQRIRIQHNILHPTIQLQIQLHPKHLTHRLTLRRRLRLVNDLTVDFVRHCRNHPIDDPRSVDEVLLEDRDDLGVDFEHGAVQGVVGGQGLLHGYEGLHDDLAFGGEDGVAGD